jgi:hypothetical protein
MVDGGNANAWNGGNDLSNTSRKLCTWYVCPELKINFASPAAMQLASKEYLFLVFQVSLCV